MNKATMMYYGMYRGTYTRLNVCQTTQFIFPFIIIIYPMSWTTKQESGKIELPFEMHVVSYAKYIN